MRSYQLKNWCLTMGNLISFFKLLFLLSKDLSSYPQKVFFLKYKIKIKLNNTLCQCDYWIIWLSFLLVILITTVLAYVLLLIIVIVVRRIFINSTKHRLIFICITSEMLIISGFTLSCTDLWLYLSVCCSFWRSVSSCRSPWTKCGKANCR